MSVGTTARPARPPGRRASGISEANGATRATGAARTTSGPTAAPRARWVHGAREGVSGDGRDVGFGFGEGRGRGRRVAGGLARSGSERRGHDQPCRRAVERIARGEGQGRLVRLRVEHGDVGRRNDLGLRDLVAEEPLLGQDVDPVTGRRLVEVVEGVGVGGAVPGNRHVAGLPGQGCALVVTRPLLQLGLAHALDDGVEQADLGDGRSPMGWLTAGSGTAGAVWCARGGRPASGDFASLP